jgi:hypothetical protein
MKAQDLLAKFPDKSFSEKFKEKESAIHGIGAPLEQVQAKRIEFKKLFDFDDLLQDLKKKLQENVEREFDSYDEERISYLLSQLSSINLYLNDLSYSNPHNVNEIFQKFTRNVSHFFQQVNYNINSSGISSGKQTIDELIQEIRQILRNFDTFTVDKQKLQEADTLATKLVKNSEKYERAINTAENWIKSEGRALSSSLQDKGQIFNDKANSEHRTREVWGWFVGGILGGAMAFVTILCFVFKNGTDISVGSAFLRISALIVVSYFAVYCLQQFSNHRKLYEAYKFKAIALRTMEELIKSYADPSDRERILDKSVSVIFSEPNIKEDKAIQQKLVDQLFEILKKKI